MLRATAFTTPPAADPERQQRLAEEPRMPSSMANQPAERGLSREPTMTSAATKRNSQRRQETGWTPCLRWKIRRYH